MKKQKPYRRRRRRMDKFEMNEISFVDKPAQEGALAVLTKADAEDMSVDELLDDDIDKRGDLVDLVTSSDEGHAHGIGVHEDHEGVTVVISYAAGPEGEMHDHQVVDDNGFYTLTENHGHTHTIDQDAMRQALMDRLTKQGPSREVRERLAETGAALPDGSFPIRNGTDLRNAISAFGRANPDDRRMVANHIRRRARALGMTDDLPQEGVLADLLKADNDGEQDTRETHMSDDLKKAQERIDALEADNARLGRVVAFSPAHKAHYDTLEGDDQTAFLEAPVDKRDAIVKAAEVAKSDADPVVYTADDGTEFRKSDDPRMIKIAKQADESRRDLAKERDKIADMDLTKRAEGFAFLKGDADTRKALLKAVDAIDDETVRDKVMETLRAANQTNEPLFQTIGKSNAPSADDKVSAEDELDRITKDRIKKSGGDYYEVYSQVANENPELKKQAIGSTAQ